MRFEELLWRTRELAGREATSTDTDPQDLGRFVNEAYLSICTAADWPFLYDEPQVSVAAGQAVVELPAVVSRVDYVAAPDGDARLPRLLFRSAAQLASEPPHRTTGDPWAYAVVGDDRLRLHPTPGAALEVVIAGWGDAVELVEATDEPVFRPPFHPMIAYEAARLLVARAGGDTSELLAQIGWYLARMADWYGIDEPVFPPAIEPRAVEGVEG